MSSERVPVVGEAVYNDEGTLVGKIDEATEAEYDEDTESWEVEVGGDITNIEWDYSFDRWMVVD